MADTTPKAYSADPTLYLYTSLTAGSSHIITATSRLETILKANKVPFRALDVATDEKARMLWGRRAKGRKLPGLVRYGSIVGDLEEIEEWNEYGELKQQIGSVPPVTATPTSSNSNTPSKGPRMPSATLLESSPEAMSPRPASPSRGSHHIQIMDPAEEPSTPKKEETPLTLAMRQAGEEAARKAGDKKIADKHQSTQTPSADISIADAKRLDDSAAIPPPSGTTEAGAAVKPTPVTADREEEMAQPSAESPKGMRTSITEETRPKSSPLTQESAAESTASLQLEASDEKSPVYLHRGSSISMASKDEIAEVEKSQAIIEEDEGDDSEACVPTGSPKIAGTTATTGVTSSTKEETPAEASAKTQAQGAKEYGNAGVSVGD